jgi:hypothetical protein
MNANTTHGLTIDIDGKDVDGVVFGCERDEILGIFLCIRMRKSIGHKLRNFWIVGVLNQTFQIGKGPGSEAEGH